MIRVHWGFLLTAGLCMTAIWPAPAGAQVTPAHMPPAAPGAVMAPAPCPSPAGPPELASPGPAPTLIMPTPPPTPPCDDGTWLGRWRSGRYQARRYHQEKWLGYPEEFNEWPLGRTVYAHGNTQVANGNAARMTFYEYDFVDGGTELNTRGRDKLVAIGCQLPSNFFPVVIERTPKTPGLDQARRTRVLELLAGGSFPVPAERVVVGPALATGQMSADAMLVERNRLGSVMSQGGLGGVAGAGAGTAVGASPLDGSGLSGGTVAPGVR